MIVSLDEIITTNNQFYYFKSHKVPFAFRQRAVEIVDIADVQDLEVWGERYCQITNKFAHVNKPFFFFGLSQTDEFTSFFPGTII